MSRVRKKDLRFMRDKRTFALDTMSGVELLNAAELCMKESKGDQRYSTFVRGILQDAKGSRDFYVTGKMRRVLMGFIRPVFEEEWLKRSGNLLTSGVR